MTEARRTKEYILYARKSEENDERQVQSIDDQIRLMQELAKERGLAVLEVFAESHSAKEPESRPKFRELLERIRAEEGVGLLAWSIDRLSRNPIDSAHLQWLLQSGAISAIQTANRVYLPEDNALVLSVETSMANQYIRDLSRNVKRGLKSKAERGWFPGRAPLGYLNTKTQERGKNRILPDPERLPLLRKAFDLLLSGAYVPHEILAILNEEWGLRTPKRARSGGGPLSLSGFYRILHNPFYAGLYIYKGVWYQGQHQAILSVEEFDRVQERLGSKGKPLRKQHSYAFTGLFTCQSCGHQITATTITKTLATGERKSFVYYYCHHARRTKGAGCSETRYLNEEALREALVKELAEVAVEPQLVEWAIQVLERDEAGYVEQVALRKQSLKTAQQKLEQELRTLRRMRLKEQVSDEEYGEERFRIQGEIAKLQQRLDKPESMAEDLQRLTERALHLAESVEETLQSDDEKRWRHLLFGICSNRSIGGGQPLLRLKKWTTRLANDLTSLKKDLPLFKPGNGGSAELPKAVPASVIPRLCAVIEATRNKIYHERG